ncbi:MAG: hypothetical protein AAGA58_15210 [Verrucomicrobiota bacterium]
MKPVINIEELPEMTVGKRVVKNTLVVREGGKEDMEAWRRLSQGRFSL